MNKVLIRILLFFIGLPALLALSLWNWASHLPLAIATVAVSALAADEAASLFRHRGFALDRTPPFLLGIVFPALAYLELTGVLTSGQSLGFVALVVLLTFFRPIFASNEESLVPVLGRVAGNLFVLVYPGIFLYFLLKINSLPDSPYLIPVFLLSAFGNDAWAWLFGTLWGRRSLKPFLVSPSKSVIGFVGGTLASFLVLLSAFFLFPGLLGRSLPAVLVLSLVLALTTIVGDLFESSLKRSAGVKDSGTIIPGRGGVLDSIDSLLFSAPLFYLFLQYGRF